MTGKAKRELDKQGIKPQWLPLLYFMCSTWLGARFIIIFFYFVSWRVWISWPLSLMAEVHNEMRSQISFSIENSSKISVSFAKKCTFKFIHKDNKAPCGIVQCYQQINLVNAESISFLLQILKKFQELTPYTVKPYYSERLCSNQEFLRWF